MIISLSELSEKHYSKKVESDVSAICAPLKELGITHFMHGRFFKSGSTFCLTNHWSSYYNHCKKEYVISPPVSKKVGGKKFFYIPAFQQDGKFNVQMYDWQNSFNIGQPIYFIEHETDYFDLFVFGSTPDNLDIINFYIGNIDILEKFKLYFKSKAKKLIEKSTQNRVWLPGVMSANMLAAKDNHERELFKNNILRQLEIKQYILPGIKQDISLSRRELDTIRQLTNGCTVKEAARNLDLSPRTVESYLNNIKYKLCLTKKSEIIQLLSELDQI